MQSFKRNMYKFMPQSTVVTEPGCDDGIDIVFIFDYTGTMAENIETAKLGVESLVQTVKDEVGANDYRLGLVLADETDSETTSQYSSSLPYTELPGSQKLVNSGIGGKFQWITTMEMMSLNNETSFNTQLQKLNGDLPLGDGELPPEPVDFALSRVAEFFGAGNFRSGVAKYILVITDAAPSGTDDVAGIPDLVEIGRLTQVCIDSNIKVLCLGSGVDVQISGQYPWRDIATGTGGAFNNTFSATNFYTIIKTVCNS